MVDPSSTPTHNHSYGLADGVKLLRGALTRTDVQGDWLAARCKDATDFLDGFLEATGTEPTDELRLLPDLTVSELRELAAECQVRLWWFGGLLSLCEIVLFFPALFPPAWTTSSPLFASTPDRRRDRQVRRQDSLLRQRSQQQHAVR